MRETWYKTNIIVDYEIFNTYRRINKPFLINSLEKVNEWDVELCNKSIIELKSLLREIKSKKNKSSLKIKKAYVKKINHQILKQQFLVNFSKLNDKANYELSKKIYTRPKKYIFKDICWRIDRYVISRIPKDAKLTKEEKEFIKLIQKNTEKVKVTIKNKDFLNIKKSLRIKLPRHDFIDDHKKYKPNEIKRIINDHLESNKLKYQAVLSDSNNYFVSHKNKKLYVPKDKVLSGLSVKKIIAHEVRCHIVRKSNSKHNRCKLLGLGTDSYEFFEEGLATLFEQVYEKKFSGYRGMCNYFAISVAAGLLDNKKRNKKELIKILKTYFGLKYKYVFPKKDYKKTVSEKSKRTADRVFRGFSGNTRGCCFTKDLIYRESNMKIWKMIIEGGEIDYDLLMIGRFNLFSKDDVYLVKKFGQGLVPDDLFVKGFINPNNRKIKSADILTK